MSEFNSPACRAELVANIKSNQHRIDELTGKVNDMQEIVVCIREIAVEMRGMKEAQEEIKRNQEKSQEEAKKNQEELRKSQEKSQDEFRKSQEELARQLREVERAPEKKSASYVDKAVNAAIAAIVAFVMTKILGK